MLKYLEKLEIDERVVGERERASRGVAVVGQAEVDLVDDQLAAARARRRRRCAHLVARRPCVPVGFDGEAISAPRVRGVQFALDQARR